MVDPLVGLSAARADFYAALPRSRLAAGALITRPAGDVLLVQPTYKPTWEIPGGSVEAHEDAPAACVRECREELGLAVPVGRLLVLDHQLDAPPRGDSIMFVYDGGFLDEPTGVTLPAAELAGYAFVAPADLEDRVIPRLARRIRCAIEARRESRVIELSSGTAWPVPASRPGAAPRLDGGDFFLDGHREGDAEAMAAGDDPENVRWLNEGHVSGLEQNRSEIARWQKSWRTGGAQRTWALRESRTGNLAGGCELRLEGSGIADFSYWIYPAYRGRGWAARGLTLIVDLAFAELGIVRATLLIEGENTASHRVAAAAGFQREGVLRSASEFLGSRHDAVSYSRLPSDPTPRFASV